MYRFHCRKWGLLQWYMWQQLSCYWLYLGILAERFILCIIFYIFHLCCNFTCGSNSHCISIFSFWNASTGQDTKWRSNDKSTWRWRIFILFLSLFLMFNYMSRKEFDYYTSNTTLFYKSRNFFAKWFLRFYHIHFSNPSLVQFVYHYPMLRTGHWGSFKMTLIHFYAFDNLFQSNWVVPCPCCYLKLCKNLSIMQSVPSEVCMHVNWHISKKEIHKDCVYMTGLLLEWVVLALVPYFDRFVQL